MSFGSQHVFMEGRRAGTFASLPAMLESPPYSAVMLADPPPHLLTVTSVVVAFFLAVGLVCGLMHHPGDVGLGPIFTDLWQEHLGNEKEMRMNTRENKDTRQNLQGCSPGNNSQTREPPDLTNQTNLTLS